MAETTETNGTKKTAYEVWEGMDDEQKALVAYLVSMIPQDGGEAKQSSISSQDFLAHYGVEESTSDSQEVYESLNPDQKRLFNFAVGKALETDGGGE